MNQLQVFSHFFSPVLIDGELVSEGCTPYRFCEAIPVDFIDNLDLQFTLDQNLFYFPDTDPLAHVANLFVAPECADEEGFLTQECWQFHGFDQASAWFPSEQAEQFIDPANYFIDQQLQDLCCVRVWRCIGAIVDEPCDEPNLPIMIQHLPSGYGPPGVSDPDPHPGVDSNIESYVFCGACNEDWLLETLPATVP